MSQDNMPALPETRYSRRISGAATPGHDGDLSLAPLYTAEQMHAYALHYAEMRVNEEREACLQACVNVQEENAGNSAVQDGAYQCEEAIRARSGAQDEGRMG